jgi:RHS repeat-associated protein
LPELDVHRARSAANGANDPQAIAARWGQAWSLQYDVDQDGSAIDAGDIQNATANWWASVPSPCNQAITKYYRLGNRLIALRQKGVLRYFHTDHLGSVSLLTDGSGQVVPGSVQQFMPFGKARPGLPVLLPTGRNFTGQLLDANTGLLYYGSNQGHGRYYDPALGRWAQPDTVVPNPGDPQDLNRYSYTRDNPLRYTDPSGHATPIQPGGCLICDVKIDISNWNTLAKGLAIVGWVAIGGHVDLEEGVLIGPTLQEVVESSVIGLANPIGMVEGPVVNAGKRVIQEGAEQAVEKAARSIPLAPRGLSAFSRAAEFGIRSYNQLTKLTAHTGLQAHHLIEERFARTLGLNPGKIPSIALTPEEHQVFTAVTHVNGAPKYGYDANGNMTDRSGATLTWDAENRLTSITEGDRLTTFAYDADGRRVKKETPWGTTYYVGDHYEKYVPTAGLSVLPGDANADCQVSAVDVQLIALKWGQKWGDAGYGLAYDVDQDGKVTAGDLQATAANWRATVASPCTNIPVVTRYYKLGGRLIALRQNGQLRFVHSDHLSSVTLLADANGEAVEHGAERYMPFGKTRTGQPALLPTERNFTGQPLDVNTGLMYYGARFYDPALGRFISADTLIPEPGNSQALNRYSYGMNNPLKFIDLTGHQGVCAQGICIDTTGTDWQQLLPIAEGLTVAAPEAGAMVVGTTGLVASSAYLGAWAMQDMGPAYPLPAEFDPSNPFGATYALPGSNTVAIDSNWLFAKPGREIAAHVAMLTGRSSVGGVPPHPGGQDPEGRDRKHNVEGLRNTLKSELKNMQRTWGKNAQPNLEKWLVEQGWSKKAVSETPDELREYVRCALETDVEHFGVPQELAGEVVDLLTQMGVIP